MAGNSDISDIYQHSTMSRCDELQKHLQEAETLIRDRKEKRRSVLLAEAEEAQQRPAPAAVR